MYTPGLAPGACVPLAFTVTAPDEPLPPSVPPLTVTADASIEPFTRSVPALSVVTPEYEFDPASVSVPVPDLTRLIAPDPFCRTPEKAVLALPAPTVRVFVPTTFLTTPPPESPLIVCGTLLSCSVPFTATELAAVKVEA